MASVAAVLVTGESGSRGLVALQVMSPLSVLCTFMMTRELVT